MKILGLLPNKREEKEIRRVIENITLLDNYTELFEKLKSDYFNILLLWTDEIKEELLLELIFRAKEINKELLVYVLGEKASIQLVAGSISAGAKDYILKPYDVQKLIFTLERDLKKNQINKNLQIIKNQTTIENITVSSYLFENEDIKIFKYEK